MQADGTTDDIAGIAGGGMSSPNIFQDSIDTGHPIPSKDTIMESENACNVELQNELKAGFDMYLARTLFVNNIKCDELKDIKTIDILKEINNHFAFEKGSHHGSYIKLIFHTKEMAAIASGKCIPINGTNIFLSPPRNPDSESPYYVKTLHIYGLPLSCQMNNCEPS